MAAYEERAKERIKRGLRKYATIVRDAQHNSINEADTRLIITAILTELLGWDTFADITTEQCIKGQYCDYGIKYEGKSMAIVEAKAVGITLSPKHLYQAVSYAANEGLDWVILTNAAHWQIYKVLFSKPVAQDLVFEVNLLDEDVKTVDKAGLLYLISREAQRGGNLDAYAKKKSALCGANVARVLLGQKMLDRLRLEMRTLHGHNASLQELATILVEEVFRADVQDDETTRLIRKSAALGRASKRGESRKRRPNDVTPETRSCEGALQEPMRECELAVVDLRASDSPLGRTEIIAMGGVPASSWPTIIRHLLDEGSVIQEGAKRGARYRVPVLGMPLSIDSAGRGRESSGVKQSDRRSDYTRAST